MPISVEILPGPIRDQMPAEEPQHRCGRLPERAAADRGYVQDVRGRLGDRVASSLARSVSLLRDRGHAGANPRWGEGSVE